MTPSTPAFLSRLRQERLVAIVRGTDPEAALRTVLTLAEEGVHLLEVSLTTAGALDVIRRAADLLGPEVLLGAGTVLDADDTRAAAQAGARWIVTPVVSEAVPAAVEAGLPVLAGALTPTEAHAAVRAGADAVKLFPASAGGPDLLRALRDPLPHIPFVPVGGVDEDAARAYLAAGAVAVGVGSPLVGDAARGGDTGGLRERARAFLAVCRAAAPGRDGGAQA
ncbi:bifunctional 4-hydroxy-2-oxoglutarate aldolase/2-dehydro-3-deoxy-phosphogluconate aldolase [Streptomyces sp. NPDC059740]|uniref:bifunctional 4-hydroxy-2-oxoglutarate aldolase/2-dehydro-3-deoxy-phosphogluconate aldolase n=1 Tax=Streptomyces sp. NPDC059740 TaxID=3346926 RepID=UPI00366628AB